MRAVVQRVSGASVTVDTVTVGSIERGLLVYLGVAEHDTSDDVAYLVRKITRMRLFTDEQGKMNRSLDEVGSQMLVVSQFTLCADLSKGNRPSFNPAAAPQKAQALYEQFVEAVREGGFYVATGEFGASMRVTYTNEGPVTIMVDSPTTMKQNT
jgi:D-tyrosyl-tRNA(Tyr) deacylase